jgi:pimeloyl-ACP methyl ester carboxylesterase
MNKQIIINNLLINYIDSGSNAGTNKTLLFLHGWRSEAAVWNDIMEQMEGEGAYMVALDLPGFGKSQVPMQPFTVEDYCSIVESFIHKLGLKNVVVIGHSFGGRIGIKLAATRPGLMQRLVLVDSAGFVMNNAQESGIGVLAKLVKPLFTPAFMQALRKRIYKTIGAEDYVATPGLQKTFVNVISEDLSHHLKDIHCPTLLLWGANDADTPVEFGERMKQGIAGSELTLLPNAGHFSFVDQPQKFVQLLTRFTQ